MEEKLVSKEVCDERHKNSNDKITELKANIRTSKESIGNRIDEIDIALLGDRNDPGGLLRDIVEIQNELVRHERSIEVELNHHAENIDKDLRYMKKIAWIAMGLAVIALGGRFFGIGMDSLKKNLQKDTTPIVAPAPKIEKDDKIPIKLQEQIKKLMQNYDKDHSDTPEDNIKKHNNPTTNASNKTLNTVEEK